MLPNPYRDPSTPKYGDSGKDDASVPNAGHSFPRLAQTTGSQRYSCYLDPHTQLADRVNSAFTELAIFAPQEEAIRAILAPLKVKHLPTYEHCCRVGLLARAIARHEHLDERALFYAGMLHDAGKALCAVGLLDKFDGWSQDDSRAMEQHVTDGYRMLLGKFDFTADVIVLHHRFQEIPYPTALPPLAHSYSAATVEKIQRCARLLALADSFDALHRINCRNGARAELSGEQIKARMLEANRDERPLIEALYAAGVFTLNIFSAPEMH